MNFLASKGQLRASFLRWALFLVPLIVLLGFLAGQLGSPDTIWFQSLKKPAIFPPPAAFGIVWTILFICIGLSFALIASAWGAHGRGLALGVLAVQFLITQSWSAAFFGMQNMQAGLIIIGISALILIPAIVLVWRVRWIAGALLLPYLAWVCFAGVLNWQFMVENPDGGITGLEEGAVERIEL